MQSVKFETKFVANTPSGPTLSVAGNNVGLGLVSPVQNLRPKLPPPVATMHGYRTQTIVSGSTRIDLGAIEAPPSGNMSDCVGATYLRSLTELNNYMAGPHTTPAFYFPNFDTSIPFGTTITAVDPTIPPRYFDISSAATANIPVPILPPQLVPHQMY